MKKINKIVNIALIFTLIGVFLCQDIAYSDNISHLRPPSRISTEELIKRYFSVAAKNNSTLEIDIEWITRTLFYNGSQIEISAVMKENIKRALLDISNGFLRKTISKYLKRNTKIEDIKKIKSMEIEFFQIGDYNHIFKVSTFLGPEKVVFGLVIANDSSLNKAVNDDFANISLLRERLPRFKDLLQNPYALNNGTPLSMFSCEWFYDYYELGIKWNVYEQKPVFYIHDKAVPPRRTHASSRFFYFTVEETNDIVREILRMLTIFFDEERKECVDLSLIWIRAGDFVHDKDVSKPKLKLITVRNIKKSQGVKDFIRDLLNFKEVIFENFVGYDLRLEFSDHRKTVAEGILKGLQDKHGEEKGKERFRAWRDKWLRLGWSRTVHGMLPEMTELLKQADSSREDL